MNANNQDQHQRRPNKFGESKYRGTHLYVGPKGVVYYIPYIGTKFIANKKFAINLLRPNLLRD